MSPQHRPRRIVRPSLESEDSLSHGQTPAHTDAHWDPLRRALQARRAEVGNPSYAEIALRIAHEREMMGTSEHAARVARSTVYDAFRLGRARINLSLVRDIAHALDTDETTIDSWVAACHHPPATSASRDDVGIDSADAEASDSVWSSVLVVAACVTANILGRVVVDVLHLPIYLDMVGTAIAAVALGPWRGAATGLATNLVGAMPSGWVSLPFALVNVVGALVWGYGVHRFRWGRSLPRFLVLNILVALACSIVAVPILLVMFGGSVGQGQDTITQTFSDLVHNLTASVGLANLLTSLIDKLLSGFIAIAVVTGLPAGQLRARSDLPALTGPDVHPQTSLSRSC